MKLKYTLLVWCSTFRIYNDVPVDKTHYCSRNLELK